MTLLRLFLSQFVLLIDHRRHLLLQLMMLAVLAVSPRLYAQSLDEILNPNSIQSVVISPDGQHIAAIAFNGLNRAVYVLDVDTREKKIIHMGKWVVRGFMEYKRQARRLFWVGNDLLALDFGAYSESVDMNGKKVQDIGDTIVGKLDGDAADSPMLLVRYHYLDDDVSLVNARTGKMTDFSLPSRGKPLHWTFDSHGQLKAITMLNSAFWKDATTVTNWYKPAADQPWAKLAEFKVTDNYWYPVGVSTQPDSLLVMSSIGRDTNALFRYDTAKNQMAEMMAGHPSQDILEADIDQLDLINKVTTNGMRPQQYWFDTEWAVLQKSVDAVLPNRVNIISGNAKRRVLVYSRSDTDPGRWYILNIQDMQLHLILEARPKINPDDMLPMDIISYPATDGLRIPAYLTRPAKAKGMQPTIVLIHGGPTVRDTWGWNEEVQLLAKRGYVVFQPQFRGSYGFGRKFMEAGYRQWGKAMQDDLTSGVEYLIKEGIADPARICIAGASYGGYAALWGLVKTPDLYRCGISFAGVSDIAEMLSDSSDSNSDKITREIMRHRIGNLAENKQEFDDVSPLKHADRIKAPLLLMHGEDDIRVPISHSKRMKAALDQHHKTYQWLSFPEEGHGLYYIKNQWLYYQTLFKFLDQYNPPDKQANTLLSKDVTEDTADAEPAKQ